MVNLDPHHVQSGWVELDLAALGLDAATPYQVHDLLSEQRYQWRGARNFVMLDPGAAAGACVRSCAGTCAASMISTTSCETRGLR